MGTDCPPPFQPAGHVYTAPSEPGAPLGWATVLCRLHAAVEDRFVPRLMGPEDPYPGLWGVWDRGTWALAGGEVDAYTTKSSAMEARWRLRNLNHLD
ncbi:hypothetical protein ACFV1L_10595 [Kitasatospora sp. NPDC059646]|uniref:hypothetical protein n=1 Tax=Kitasatospora sp. NPDC059646 TaxID=3346893 RepID=UPI0036D1CCED